MQILEKLNQIVFIFAQYNEKLQQITWSSAPTSSKRKKRESKKEKRKKNTTGTFSP